ncbi:MAG: hypothetical protein AAF713_09160 [Pseudomonadota bacterium]
MAETSAEWVKQPESGRQWQLRMMRGLALTLPPWALDPLIWAIALVFAANRARPATRASGRYLQRLFGRPARLSERHRHARVFAHAMLDRVRLLARGTADFKIAASGNAPVEKLYAAKQGAVLLGSHYGSFEALRAFDRTMPDMVVRYVMSAEHAAKSTALLGALNPAVTARVISVADGPQGMLDVYEALERGEFVAFLGDRVPDRAARGQVAVDFLGGDIQVPTSPYLAAMAAGVPLIFCTAPRTGPRRYALEFAVLHGGEPVPREERGETVGRLAQAYADLLSERCRRDPYNWFNFFDIWRV